MTVSNNNCGLRRTRDAILRRSLYRLTLVVTRYYSGNFWLCCIYGLIAAVFNTVRCALVSTI